MANLVGNYFTDPRCRFCYPDVKGGHVCDNCKSAVYGLPVTDSRIFKFPEVDPGRGSPLSGRVSYQVEKPSEKQQEVNVLLYKLMALVKSTDVLDLRVR